jgi:hypothetical protein
LKVIELADGSHPAASHHMPWFISGPHEGDPLYVITTVCVIGAVVGLGVLFFTLHSLPERLGHKKVQFEVVAVLGLLSLFTHIHAFWIAGLLLALIELPDVVSPWKRMAASLECRALSRSPRMVLNPRNLTAKFARCRALPPFGLTELNPCSS